ncbi:hypothetical protein OG413_00260 [Streptomyces sp. NBC_01433]|nr:hypothetical protein [Streptomyces sp. NBC_01433]MCX4673775.1 hypothetical protein [Streptomyces sp. NBC_01433]
MNPMPHCSAPAPLDPVDEQANAQINEQVKEAVRIPSRVPSMRARAPDPG